jgi:hypothetical protein
MRYLILLALSAIGLLTLGCTYSAEYGAEGVEETQTPGSGQTGSPSAQAAAEADPQAPSDQPVLNQQDAPSDDGIDRSGMAYDDLLMLGSGSRCDVVLHSEEGDRRLDMLFDGEGMMRIDEDATGNPFCPHLLVIFNVDSKENGFQYVNCPGYPDAIGTEFGTDTKCDWQSMEVEAEWGGVGSTIRGLLLPDDSRLDTPYLDQTSDYSCSAWNVDASQFEVPGYICD